MATVKNWFTEFQRSCTSVFDDPRPGAPKRLPRRITWQKSTFSYWSARDSWDSAVKRPCGLYPAWNIGHEKAVGAMGRQLQNSVWHCLSTIRRSFCVVSWPSTKHGSTGTHQRPRNSRNSGLYLANVLRKRRILSYRLERWWPSFSGIHKVWSTSTTWRRAKQSQGSTMPNYWADLTLNCRKNYHIWRRKKSSSTMTTHQLTPRRHHGHIGRIRLWTAAPSTLFIRFGPVQLIFISKLEKVTRRAEIWVK